MQDNIGPDILLDYSEGRRGTRATIDALGLNDYADLLIALVQRDLPLPKPDDTPLRQRHDERARAILLPLLLRNA